LTIYYFNLYLTIAFFLSETGFSKNEKENTQISKKRSRSS